MIVFSFYEKIFIDLIILGKWIDGKVFNIGKRAIAPTILGKKGEQPFAPTRLIDIFN
jgi:hypothetical protein